MDPQVPVAFISYRREDARDEALLCARELRRAFGESSIFLDVDEIEPGAVWSEKLEGTLAAAAVVLVFIGPKWLAAADEHGRRRLDARGDWVRREVATALETGKVVIPVLVSGAELPAGRALPKPIRPLLRFQAVRLSERPDRADLGPLLAHLEARGFSRKGDDGSRVLDPVVHQQQVLALKRANTLVYRARNAAKHLHAPASAPRANNRSDYAALSETQAHLVDLLEAERALLPPRVFALLHQLKYQLIDFGALLETAAAGEKVAPPMLFAFTPGTTVPQAYAQLDAGYHELTRIVQKKLGVAGAQ